MPFARHMMALVVSISVAGCGYHSLASAPKEQRLAVVLRASHAVDAMTAAEVLVGVRDTLAHEGLLRDGTEMPRIEVEVTGDEFAGAGVTAVGGVPLAQSSEARLIGRAWLVRERNESSSWETGDMRATSLYAAQGDEVLRSQTAARAAARELGQRLGLRALGEPTASGFSLATDPRR